MADQLRIPEDLTDAERRYLAMHARYEATRQAIAEQLADAARWRAIADVLHLDPWGPS